MSQALAIVLGLLALAIVVAVPVGLVTVFRRRAQRAYAELAAWAGRRGLTPGKSSALPRGLAAHVSAVHFELDGGALSVSVVESRQQAHVTFYYRPRARPPGGDFSVQRRSWGAAGRAATGDAAFDGLFLISAQDDAAWRALLGPELRELLVQRSGEVWSLGQQDGTLIYGQVGELVDAAARDRALELLRRLAGAPRPGG